METLASKLKNPMEFYVKVKQVQKIERGGEVEFQQNNETKTLEADSLIYAGTGHQLANCKIINKSELNLSFGNDIEYPPVSVLMLGYHTNQIQHDLNGFGMLVPKVENLKILGALFNSSLFPGRAPKDYIALTVFIGGARQP